MKKLQKINNKNIRDVIGLTPMQKGMLYHYLKTPGSDLYFEQLCLELSGGIDIEIFERAWNKVVETNEMLRVLFRWEQLKDPVQLILKEYHFKPKYIDGFKGIQEIKTKDRNEGFDLREVPFRVTLCKEAEKKFYMILSHHHILYDGWSTGIILEEFFRDYNDLFLGKPPVQPVKTKFKEFVKWLKLKDRDQKQQQEFWSNYLKGIETKTVPFKKGKKPGEIDKAGIHKIKFPGDLKKELEHFVKEQKITLASLLYSAWGVLLQKYNNTDDVIFGTTVSGRPAQLQGIEETVGLFINTLPLRVRTRDNDKVEDLMYRVHNALQMREAYQSASLVNIRKYSEINTKQELFDSIITIENYPLKSRLMLENSKISVNSYSIEEITPYDLAVGVMISDEIEVKFVYYQTLFDEDTIPILAGHFRCIVGNFIENPLKKLSDVEIIPGLEKEKILHEFNRTGVNYPADKTIHQLFVEQVKRTPDHIAVMGPVSDGGTIGGVWPGRQGSLSYRQLNQRSGQLLGIFGEKGVKPGIIIGILLERSVEMVVGILAILKAGCAYLPIDTESPRNRIKYMIEDSNCQLLLTQPHLADRLEFGGAPVVQKVIEVDNRSLYPYLGNNNCDSPNLTIGTDPKEPAYIIYTSGSAGKPKGVLIQHVSVVNLAFSQGSYFNISADDRILQFSSICFDASVEQIFITLFYGAQLVLIDKETILDKDKFEVFIASRAITHLHAVPSFLNSISLKDSYQLKRIISGGDICPVPLAKKLSAYCDVYNEYGPTETTVTSIEMKFEDVDDSPPRLPIGRPLSNTRVYLLDRWLKLVPVGITGELYIGGAGVGLGYLNKPELTTDKFIQQVTGTGDRCRCGPVYNKKLLRGAARKAQSAGRLPPGRRRQKIYKTGDLVRWLPDGNMEFLGRLDSQVKIRGFRIEPGEIEKRLLTHKGIKEAVVIDREMTGGEKYLCAYIVPKGLVPGPSSVQTGEMVSLNMDARDLKEYLSKELPDHMIPSYFVLLETMPLNANGKLDRKALPEPVFSKRMPGAAAAPRTGIEKKLAKIWEEILRNPVKPGIDDDFFEAGGHSLNATGLVNRIHKEFQVKVSLTELFKKPTIRELAQYIKDTSAARYTSIEPVESKEYYPLSSSQKRLYILQQKEVNCITYNMMAAIPLKDDPDMEKLAETFKKLIQRHESLRTSFHMADEEPVQRVHDRVNFEIEYLDLKVDRHKVKGDDYEGTSGLAPLSGVSPTRGSQLAASTIKHFIRPFDLSLAPLLRVGLMELPRPPAAFYGHSHQERKKQQYILMIDMHHIVSDGVSNDLLIQDFTTMFRGREAGPLRLRYKDFSQWQNSSQMKEKLKEQEVYWLEQLDGEIPVLNLPFDYPRPPTQSVEGNVKDFEISRAETAVLKQLSVTGATTLFMVLLAIYNVLLARLSSQEDIVIGTPIAGRRHPDLEKIMGMFVNTLALRNFPKGEKSFLVFLEEVKKRSWAAFENQEYPFEDLVNKLVLRRDTGTNPIFDVMFALNTFAGESNIDDSGDIPFDTVSTGYRDENGTSKFDLTLTGWERDEGLFFSFQYCTKLFKEDTIERFIGYFKRIIRLIVKEPAKKIRQIEIVSEEEKNHILSIFNDTEADYPSAKTIPQLFGEQAEKSPDHAVLIGPGRERQGVEKGGEPKFIAPGSWEQYIHLTYNRLNRASNQLACLLQSKGITPGAIVAVMAEPSLEMMIGILAVLKSAGCYLPIDPVTPERRIAYMLADSEAKLFLTQKHLESKVNAACKVVNILDWYEIGEEKFQETGSANDPIYMIYTSGTTGKPKGVLLTHENLLNYITWFSQETGLNQADKTLLTTSFSFDLGYTSIYPSLLKGGQLHLLPKEIYMQPENLLNYISTYQISYLKLTPSFFSILAANNHFTAKTCQSLDLVVLGGEAINAVDVEKVHGICPHIRMMNHYGPTEATIGSIARFIDFKHLQAFLSRPTIGKPIFNTRVFILDRYSTLLPVGIGGELCISGAGTARGYLNNPELTAQKFYLRRPGGTLFEKTAPPGPPRKNFSLKGSHKNHMQPCNHAAMQLSFIYLTGDLARWLPDGNIEFLGRIDQQVKVRGYRVEPGEIETRIYECEGIKAAVVLAAADNGGNKYLCAYIVPHSHSDIESYQLRKYLSTYLPAHMIPSHFIFLDQIPLTPNGKLDKKRLPCPGFEARKEYAAPRDKIEKKLVKIWRKVLGQQVASTPIGIEYNFFELGGHSLAAAVMISKVQKELNVKLPLSEVFKRPTIRGLAESITEISADGYVSIEPVEKKEYYLLSSAQKRLYILQQMELKSTAYNMPAVIPLRDAPDMGKFTFIFKKLIRRHESLRTSFHMVADEPVQKIHEEFEFEIEYCSADGKAQRAETKEERHAPCAMHCASTIKNFIRPFDLTFAPLLRVRVAKLPHTPAPFRCHPCQEGNKQQYILMIDMHHIVCDGVSNILLIRNFMELYRGQEPEPLRLRYKDFSRWQDKEKKKLREQQAYWLRQFNDEIPVLDLPFDYQRPLMRSFEGSVKNFEISQQETATLKQFSLTNGTTLFILLLAIFNVLLSKLSSQEDIVIGTPIAGRIHSDLEKIVGMFVNTLALRSFPLGEKSFLEFLEEVTERTLAAFENQEFPFEELVDKLALRRDTAANPIFDVMFTLNTIKGESNSDDTHDTPFDTVSTCCEHEYGTSKFDLTLTAREREKRLLFSFRYCTKLFKEETIERFIDYFEKITRFIVKEPGMKLWQVEMLSQKEKHRILYDFNDTKAQYPKDKTLHQLFEKQIERTPHHIALVFYDRALTYRDLHQRSTRLAKFLRVRGLKPGHKDIAAILLDRCPAMIISMLAVLKAGGAYLPLDPFYPLLRIRFMLDDSNTRMLITNGDIWGQLNDEVEVIDVNDESIYRYRHPADILPGVVTTPGHAAYVIYTSGSAGKPKGVVVEHRNAVNVVTWFARTHHLHQDTHVLLMSDYTFDPSVNQFFGTLLHGGTLYIISKELLFNIEALRQYVRTHDIHVLNFVPMILNQLLGEDEKLRSVKVVLSGGERLDDSVKNRIIGRGYRLYNHYGPTETTIDALASKCSEEKVNLGKPISNVWCCILDRYRQVLPVKVAGELYISGTGVARGYLNNPELTNDKFLIINSKSKTGKEIYTSHMSYITYRTGDLARWSSDGNIEFLGRIDHQVKIRGYRIEPEEIETHLLKHQGIKEAVVTAGGAGSEKGDIYLCAYVVGEPASPGSIDPMGLKRHLSQYLPGYMIPSYFVQINHIPLTANGKLDRNALPAPPFKNLEEYVAPWNEVQEKLLKIWLEVLGEQVSSVPLGIDDNFFHLGGHSLGAAVLISKIHKELDVRLPLAKVFEIPHIRGLAQYIKNISTDRYVSIDPVEKKDYYLLSSPQKRLYILQQMEPNSTAYNIPAVIPCKDGLDIEKIAGVFKKLIRRHESLRTSFHLAAGEPVQKIHDKVSFKIEYVDLKVDPVKVKVDDYEGTRGLAPLPIESPTCSQQLAESTIKNFIRPFDLTSAPLLRVGLMELPHKPTPFGNHPCQEEKKRQYILMIDMHHIVSDGISSHLMIQDFMVLYPGGEPEPLRLQYKDFSQWQHSQEEKKRLEAQEIYWLKQFEGEIPVLDIPLDYPRPPVQSFEGSVKNFEISREETALLKQFSVTNAATLFMVLLAIHNLLLARLSTQEDIVIGTPIANRLHPDLENIMGMFVNTLPLRNFPVEEKSFLIFLAEVKERTLTAFENQEYPFEELVDKLALKRDTGGNPLFDVMFALNTFTSESNINDTDKMPLDTASANYRNENRISKFDLTLTGWEKDEKLLFSIQYCTKLFKESTIERFIGYFKRITPIIVKDPQLKLWQIGFLSEHEKRQLLYDFNDTKARYPKDKTIHQLFDERVKKSPDCTAAIGLAQSTVNNRPGMFTPQPAITYRELNAKADDLARRLYQKRIQPGTIVGIMLERSIELIIGILGILKAGGSYLPIAPDFPKERINYMLEDSEAKLLVTGQDLQIENLRFHFPHNNTSAKHPTPLPGSSLAYIIYTSGSTGKPKGVLVEHRNLIAYIYAFYKVCNITAKDIVLQQAAFTFDAYLEEVFPVLLKGGRTVIAQRDDILDIHLLSAMISRYHISIISCSPFLLNELNRSGSPLESVHTYSCGGDILKKEYMSNLLKFARVLNGYGPTEATVCVTFYKCPGDERELIPIGKPIANYKVYILDKHNQLLPLGVPGELCAAGAGITRGYLNRPELTAEKFKRAVNRHLSFVISSSLKTNVQCPMTNDRLYLTGDLARWLPDGNIEFLGRIDNQVNIRGYRIELGEIEGHLTRHEKVKEAVVLAREDKQGDKYLCAYVITEPGLVGIFDASELKKYLSHSLPGYMIPAYFIRIDNIPLTINGKIDKDALPAVEFKTGETYAAPTNEVESKLVEIWAEVLWGQTSPAPISIDDNFFELGGHSLKALILITKIHENLKVKVKLVEIFQNPSIRGLAAIILENSRGTGTAAWDIPPIETCEYYPLSYNQQRLFFIHQKQPESFAFAMTGYIELTHEVNPVLVKKVLAYIIRRHESFRTAFGTVDGFPCQMIAKEVNTPFQFIDLSMMDSVERKKERDLVYNKIAGAPFELVRAPLLRSTLVKLEPRCYQLIINMHHIISDGWSMEILKKEFSQLYEGYRQGQEVKLPALPLQYKDFALWHNRQLESPGSQKFHQSRKEKLSNGVPALKLPADWESHCEDNTGAGYKYIITGDTTAQLKKMAGVNHITLFTLMFSIYVLLLSHICRQEDIVCSVIAAGRDHHSLQDVVGFFVNSIINRTRLDEHLPFKEFLTQVNREIIETFQHQSYPLELVFEDLGMRYPEIPTAFNMINIEDTIDIGAQIPVEPIFLDAAQDVKFDLEVYVEEYINGIKMHWAYKKNMFKPTTIDYMIKLYIKQLEFFVKNPNHCFKDYLAEKKKQKPRKVKFKKMERGITDAGAKI